MATQQDAALSAAAAASTAPVVAAATVPLVHIYTQNISAQLPAGTHMCAGALPTAQRLAAPNIDTVFVASDNQLSLLQPSAPANPVLRLGRQGPFASDFIPLSSRLTTLDAHKATSELQTVAARSCGSLDQREYLVASVDSYGSAVLSRVHVPHSGTDGDDADVSTGAPFRVLSSARQLPGSRVEDGWHGVALHPISDEQTCVASYYGKSLSLYQGEQLLQTLYTAASPTSVHFMQSAQFSAPLLLCNEGNVLSVWDVRMSNGVGQCDNISRGAVQRLQDTMGNLFALDSHESGLVATGGTDKQVTVYDCRKWGVAGRWKNVLKYELMSLHFSAYSPSMLYVAGLDHEIYAGHWSNQSLNARNLERSAFRGDSRWVGLARTTDPEARRGGDNLVGITQTGRFYVLRNAHLQSGPVSRDNGSSGATGAATSTMSSAELATRKRRDEVTAARKERVAAGLSALTPEEQQKRARTAETRKDRKRKAEAAGCGAEAGAESAAAE